MKAKEHVTKWHEFYKDNSPEVWKDKPADVKAEPGLTATAAVCTSLLHEIQDLIKMRSAKKDSAIAGVITEINRKWISIARQLNHVHAGEGAFMAVLENVLPELYDAYQKYQKSAGVKMVGRA